MEHRSGQPRRRLRIILALLALSLLPWGAAAFTIGARTGEAQAASSPQIEDHDMVLALVQGGQTYYIKIQMLMYPGAAGFVDPAAIEAARADMLSRFPGAYEVGEGSVAAQFVLTGFKWPGGLAAWAYNGSDAPAGVAGSASMALQAAAATWGTAGANFHFSGGGPTSAGTGACGGANGAARDGQNTVGWAAQSGSVLAVTCSWYGGGLATEFDMQIDPGWNWSTGPSISIDLQSVALHEFGHALGLQHSSFASAVMYASYSAGANKRALTQDDIDGVTAIYGGAGGGSQPANTPASTATPRPSNTATPRPTNTATPTNTPKPANTPKPPPTNPPTATPNPGGGQAQPTSTPTATATPRPNTPAPTPTKAANTPAPATATPTSTPTKAASTPAPSPSPAVTPTKASGNPNPGAPRGRPKNSLPIVPGSNLLTWPGDDASAAEALGGESGILRIVYAWDPATGTWLRYAPGLPSYLNNLKVLRAGQPYWFIANSALQLPYTR